MCYPAMVREQFAVLIHVTGAKISIREFVSFYAFLIRIAW